MEEKILSYIEKNGRIDVHDLAALVGEDEVTVMNLLEEMEDISNVSVSYLSRKFKQIIGMGISEYIQMYRINIAKKLLVQSDESILSISSKCGFNDSNYFSSVFKRKEGISPLKYRKRYL